MKGLPPGVPAQHQRVNQQGDGHRRPAHRLNADPQDWFLKPATQKHEKAPPKAGQSPNGLATAVAYPGKVNMASGGTGNATHLTGELFKMMAGVDMVHVPYRGGGPAFADLLGRQVQVFFPTMVSSIEYVRAGSLRVLALTTATRSEALPDIPTVGEFVPGYEASSVYGLGAPKNTPTEIVDKLNREINAALADPKLKAQLADVGGDVLALSSRGAVQNCLLKNLMQTPQANVEKLGRFDDRVRAWINSGRS